MRGDSAFCKSVDNCIALAWRLAAQTCNKSISDSALLSMRGLGLLTERIPSPDIHGGLFSAMLDLSASFSDRPPPSAECRRVSTIVIPAWFKTLDKASRAQMAAVMKGNRLFAPADYFVGFAWAWRFGIDRAADYLGAMQEGLAPNVRLPLPKASECEVFANIIAKSLPIEPDAGCRAMINSIFHGMRSGPPALEGWAQWLAAVFAGLPHVNWLVGDDSTQASKSPLSAIAAQYQHDRPEYVNELAGDVSYQTPKLPPAAKVAQDQHERPEPELHDPLLISAQSTPPANESKHAAVA